MLHQLMGWAHAQLAWALREDRGQGTVEYVGLLLLLATLLTAVVASAKSDGGGIAKAITGKLKQAIDSVKATG
jgi:hypothetical protein